jgi:cysteine desulfurase
MEETAKKRVYLDSAATTYVNREVLAEMMPVFNSTYGNAASIHSFGRDAQNLLDEARAKVASGINANANEIYFTSGGTEANNWAILGLARANKDKGKHIITSKIEHESILDSCKELEKEGFDVTYVGCDESGMVSLTQIMSAIRPDTILISVMVANNEVGTIQNLNAIARTAKEKDILFHCDAVQALGAIPLDVKTIPIDAMTLSSHKIYGPKGIGALYVKKGVKIDNLIFGGKQEGGKRSGTVNVAGAVGFGKAVEIATRDVTVNAHKIKLVRDYFVKSVMDKIENVELNGHQYQRVCGIANLCFECVDNESLLLMLDMEGVACSIGSACTAGTALPSYVLRAMGKTSEQIKSSIRFSFGKNISKEDVDYVVDKLVSIVKKLRDISPLRKTTKESK